MLYFEDCLTILLECRLLFPNLALDFKDGNFVSTDLFSESKLLASIKGFASARGLLSNGLLTKSLLKNYSLECVLCLLFINFSLFTISYLEGVGVSS